MLSIEIHPKLSSPQLFQLSSLYINAHTHTNKPTLRHYYYYMNDYCYFRLLGPPSLNTCILTDGCHKHITYTSLSLQLPPKWCKDQTTSNTVIHSQFRTLQHKRAIKQTHRRKNKKKPLALFFSLQCLNTVGWATDPACKKLDVRLLVVMIWLELCTTYSSSSPVVTTTSIILCFRKHRLTQVHLENGR